MKIDELIGELERVKEEHGDLEVAVDDSEKWLINNYKERLEIAGYFYGH